MNVAVFIEFIAFDQVIVLGASVGTLRYASEVRRAYFVNPVSFTPLPL